MLRESIFCCNSMKLEKIYMVNTSICVVVKVMNEFGAKIYLFSKAANGMVFKVKTPTHHISKTHRDTKVSIVSILKADDSICILISISFFMFKSSNDCLYLVLGNKSKQWSLIFVSLFWGHK